MRWSDNGPGQRRGYHHGNLREALIEAALDLIARKGPAGFTFAEAARWAGVSSAAPYRHFRDRDALIADVALRGFELFTAHLERAWNDGRPDAFAAFESVGRAYLAFAHDEPAYYSAMFEAGIPLDTDPGLREAAGRAFERLFKFLESALRYVGNKLFPVAEMPIGRRWAHASPARRLRKGEACRALLGNELECSPDKGLFQVPVMVAA